MEIFTESNCQRSIEKGERVSPQEVFDRWLYPKRSGLLLHARRLTRDINEAEDLVQETLLRAYTRIDMLNDPAKAQSWLHTILNNLFVNEYWRRKRSPVVFSYDEWKSGEIAAYNPDLTEQLVERQVQYAAILQALTALPDAFQILIYLADIKGVSYEEIATYLSLPRGTVRSRLSRGRARLLRSLYTWQDRTNT